MFQRWITNLKIITLNCLLTSYKHLIVCWQMIKSELIETANSKITRRCNIDQQTLFFIWLNSFWLSFLRLTTITETLTWIICFKIFFREIKALPKETLSERSKERSKKNGRLLRFSNKTPTPPSLTKKG